MESSLILQQAELGLQTSRTAQLDKFGRSTPEQIREKAEEFEGFFVAMVLESMFAGVKTDGLFGGGHGEKVFRSMLMQEYGKDIAQSSDLGIADAVQREMLRLQEVQA